MNTERTVVIENISDISVSLLDTQHRRYLLKKGGKIRVSSATLQDILDEPGNKLIFDRGRLGISNITRKELFNMGLTEAEIDRYLKEEAKPVVEEKPVVVITPAIEEEPVAVIEVEVPVVEEVKEETVIEEKPVVKPATKKTPAKKSAKKKGK